MINGAYLLLGSNLGDKRAMLCQAIEKLSQQLEIVSKSSLYETDAWGIEDQPSFYNCVLHVKSRLQPQNLLQLCLEIEKELGRKRIVKWGERIIDIDILYYNDVILDEPELKIPHPYIQERMFTLIPMAELAPDFVHPVFGLTQKELIAECPDTLEVRRVEW
ncbi:2-amino-4-hydroxy-6-hydroxymethyldihydropteridine diphosphokinase [Aureibacter tunicatorum]|uniref:2-amino-4-hydroxy-6-hydroxymethyldihydropteridine pyrophosphokinase n=1 Tax=Aureibacter tunicatorum TaxID=866807 RepID=A0AAE3XSZ1_9BACT|nr:2-amino-4-hydroxy-6-hydroxymethyldihydropteridine diphosphokinase [Aureibacter tunicatorum]MDR6241054.1 2-amino-4-hydroxy-6-hydroxymethyldihydropteridine diphosphokinase [Aureibacter tunicatorum]BDD03832.1 2-amino-4-hydroxy-6-hydroxymethyldihydropteridine diphosphokinase [Aureibacter tunicatorum]